MLKIIDLHKDFIVKNYDFIKWQSDMYGYNNPPHNYIYIHYNKLYSYKFEKYWEPQIFFRDIPDDEFHVEKSHMKFLKNNICNVINKKSWTNQICKYFLFLVYTYFMNCYNVYYDNDILWKIIITNYTNIDSVDNIEKLDADKKNDFLK